MKVSYIDGYTYIVRKKDKKDVLAIQDKNGEIYIAKDYENYDIFIKKHKTIFGSITGFTIKCRDKSLERYFNNNFELIIRIDIPDVEEPFEKEIRNTYNSPLFTIPMGKKSIKHFIKQKEKE